MSSRASLRQFVSTVNLQSSLLLSIMNQMPVLTGNIKVGGSISYVPQESWVYSGTLKENVLFGDHVENSKYEEVVKVCALVEVQCLLWMIILKSPYLRKRKGLVNQLMSVRQ